MRGVGMVLNRLGLLTMAAAVVFLCAGSVLAEMVLDKEGKVKAEADLRLRFESDWDSHRSDGTKRDDRDRLRLRARFGMTFQPTSVISAGFRIRSGSRASQQSPHITLVDFDDNPTGDKHLLFDRYYLRAESKNAWIWGGRNSMPFWRPNEFFWEDDVTPLGAAGGYKSSWNGGSLNLTGGYFTSPDGGVCFHGKLGAGQGVLSLQNGPLTWTFAGGLFAFFGEPGAIHLRNGNGERDYLIWVGNIQSKFKAGPVPLTLGLDLMHNSEDYGEHTPDNRERDGFVLSAIAGQLAKRGDLQVGYFYAHVEKLAVNASYAQDDWIRWGNASQTDSSDYKGHEFRVAYGFSKSWNLMARLFLVDAITSIQDGKRFRIDLNYRF
ncbi:MAG: putative porin [Acidobacteriota bacterium]|nr:MAG: putative porin [Acidobacteriota bacterium]